MLRHRLVPFVLALAIAPAGLLLTTAVPVSSAYTAPLALPDLKVEVPTSAISIGTNPSTGHRQLQFTHITWDAGTGPFAIQPTYDARTGISSFTQVVYRMVSPGAWAIDHRVRLAVAGLFQSPSDYRYPLTRFTLNKWTATGPGALVAVSPKVDYCITGDVRVGGVPNTPDQTTPPASNCGDPNALLGLSVGWGDQYDQTDNGQPIDLSGIPDGKYVLHAIADPQHIFVQSNRNNDVVDTTIQIAGNMVSVLKQSAPTEVPPTATLLSPLNGARVHGTVTLKAAASAKTPAKIVSVRYLLDGLAYGPATRTAPYVVKWPTGVLPGTHTLAVQATDSLGNTATSAPISVSVVPTKSTGLAIDAITTANGHGTVTTGPFTTYTTQDLLLAFVGADGPTTTHQAVAISGGGLTWHLIRRSNAQAGDAEIWWASSTPVLHAIRVTSREGQTGFAQHVAVVAYSHAGPLGASGIAAAPRGAAGLKLTAKASGSYLVAVGSDWDHAIARTVLTGQSILSSWVDAGDGDTLWVQSTAAANSIAGRRVTLGTAAPTTDRWDFAAVEVRRAASSPKIALANPAPGEEVSAAVPVASRAYSAAAIRSITYYVDGHVIGRATSASSFALPHWNTRTVRNGAHTLSSVVVDSNGRTARADERIVVTNPAPAMTCFVLQADVSASGATRVVTPVVRVAMVHERLLAFVRTTSAHATAVHSAGLTWTLVRTAPSSNGVLAVWTAAVPQGVHTLRVSSVVNGGQQSVTVVGMGGTDGLGAAVAASGNTARPVLHTRGATSLVFATGEVASRHIAVPAGWSVLGTSFNSSSGVTSWVMYTNQPVLVPGSAVTLPHGATSSPLSPVVAVELPGAKE